MNNVKILITGKNPNLYVKRYLLNKMEYSNYKVIDRYNISFGARHDGDFKKCMSIYD